MFGFGKKYTREGYDEAIEKQKAASRNLANVSREVGQFPTEKDEKKKLAEANTQYVGSQEKMRELLKKGQIEANATDDTYEELKNEHERADVAYVKAETAYLEAKEKYRVLTEKLENFERDTLGMTKAITVDQEVE